MYLYNVTPQSLYRSMSSDHGSISIEDQYTQTAADNDLANQNVQLPSIAF
jgi:hypothetical protein